MPSLGQRVTAIEVSLAEIRKWVVHEHSLMHGEPPRLETLPDTVTAHDIETRLDRLSKAAESLK